jgi:hypothetical protein
MKVSIYCVAVEYRSKHTTTSRTSASGSIAGRIRRSLSLGDGRVSRGIWRASSSHSATASACETT